MSDMSDYDEIIGGEEEAYSSDGLIDEDEELEKEMNIQDSDDENQELTDTEDIQFDDTNNEIEVKSVRVDSTMTRLPDIISKYQLIPLLTARMDQLNQGCRPFAKLADGSKDPRKIAIAEIVNGNFPLALVVGNIICKMSHFTHYPADFMEEMEQIRRISSPL